MRPIDADALLIKIDSMQRYVRTNMAVMEFNPFNVLLQVGDAIIASPTADVQPIVHGKWIPTKDDNKKECSNCEIIHLIAQYPHGQINYCPNCGAKMDGESNE